MFGKKIKLSDEVWSLAERASQLCGCASVEEWIEQVLKEEAERVARQHGKADLSDKEVAAITDKLKGLGYIE